MSNPIRCFTTNTTIGEYYPLYMALKAHFNEHPPATGEKTLIEHMKGLGIELYPQLMRTVATVQFIDAQYINKYPTKNNT